MYLKLLTVNKFYSNQQNNKKKILFKKKVIQILIGCDITFKYYADTSDPFDYKCIPCSDPECLICSNDICT